MVKWFFALLFLSTVGRAERPTSAPDIKFEIEYTKPEIYAGESVTAHFVIYGHDDVLEVEVIKFPEFRGFWSENLALRQGPVPLMADFVSRGWKKTTIGSYLVNSMVETKRPEVKPMKLAVRRPQAAAGDTGDQVFFSEGKPLVIKPLPPFPPNMPAKFSAGVGRFVLQVERSPVLFRRDEPAQLRLLLSGEGNFREIDEIPLPDVEGLEVLSKKTYAQGSAQYYSKSYDITFVLHKNENSAIPSFAFVYFDPLLARYQAIRVPEIPLLLAPDPAGTPRPEGPVDLGAPHAKWSVPRPWFRMATFWWIQFALLLTALISFEWLFGWARAWFGRIHLRQADPWKPRLAAAETSLKAGDVDAFLGAADSLAFDLISNRVPDAPVTRSDLLRRAGPQIGADLVALARTLFDAWNRRAYSREKPLPADPAPLLSALRTLVRKAA